MKSTVTRFRRRRPHVYSRFVAAADLVGLTSNQVEASRIVDWSDSEGISLQIPHNFVALHVAMKADEVSLQPVERDALAPIIRIVEQRPEEGVGVLAANKLTRQKDFLSNM
jgi:hypothetical protein